MWWWNDLLIGGCEGYLTHIYFGNFLSCLSENMHLVYSWIERALSSQTAQVWPPPLPQSTSVLAVVNIWRGYIDSPAFEKKSTIVVHVHCKMVRMDSMSKLTSPIPSLWTLNLFRSGSDFLMPEKALSYQSCSSSFRSDNIFLLGGVGWINILDQYFKGMKAVDKCRIVPVANGNSRGVGKWLTEKCKLE